MKLFDYVNESNWNINDNPAIEFGTPTYFYMPNRDVIISQFMVIDYIDG